MSVEVRVPKYSDIGLGNRDIFLGRRNAVLVYCEDEGFEEFYLRLLHSIDPALDIDDVFCLGGKSQVLKKMDELSGESKRRIFIVDKDFDDLLNRVRVGVGLVYLGRYSIENYFVDESLFVEFLLDRCKRLRRAAVVATLDFAGLMTHLLGWYRAVCSQFIVVQKFNLRMQSTKVKSAEFCDAAGNLIQKWWVKYLAEFREHAFEEQNWLLEGNIIDEKLAEAFEPAEACRDISDRSDLAHFPGKHLVDMILTVCQSRFGCGDPEEVRYEFLMSAAGRVDSTQFAGLRGRIAAALG